MNAKSNGVVRNGWVMRGDEWQEIKLKMVSRGLWIDLKSHALYPEECIFRSKEAIVERDRKVAKIEEEYRKLMDRRPNGGKQ